MKEGDDETRTGLVGCKCPGNVLFSGFFSARRPSLRFLEKRRCVYLFAPQGFLCEAFFVPD
jgi:hypothetical protein